MRVIRHLQDWPTSAQRAVVAVGNFDGLHLGHLALLRRAHELATAQGRPLAVLSFTPHPRRFFAPDSPAFEIMRPYEKLVALRQLGIAYFLWLKFNKTLANMPAQRFLEEILWRHLAPAAIVVGEDFHFGAGRKGDLALLAKEALQQGVSLHSIAMQQNLKAHDHQKLGPPKGEGQYYSSTALRQALQQAEIEALHAGLGRPYSLFAKVRRGQQLARQLGFPTANLALQGRLLPRFGAYILGVRCQEIMDPLAPPLLAVGNIGVKPTLFPAAAPLLEVHILPQNPRQEKQAQGADRIEIQRKIAQFDLYGQRLEVFFWHFLRPERRFADLSALKAQIGEDCLAAYDWYHSAPSDVIMPKPLSLIYP
jgi:riboflavin kinase / FMN adenylyltransferase